MPWSPYPPPETSIAGEFVGSGAKSRTNFLFSPVMSGEVKASVMAWLSMLVDGLPTPRHPDDVGRTGSLGDGEPDSAELLFPINRTLNVRMPHNVTQSRQTYAFDL